MHLFTRKILSLIIITYLLISLSSCKMYYYIGGSIEDVYFGIKGTIVRTLNRNTNNDIIEKYLVNNYSLALYEYLTIKDINREWNESQGYSITVPFMSKPFEVWIDNRTHEISGDNFYDTLIRDPKFNHLYSEWVKKKIGQDDPNVELIMIFNNNIDFLNIKNDDDDILEQLFKSIKEYKVTNAYVKNVRISNETDLADYAKNIHDIYFTFKNYNEESSGEFNLNDSVILIKEDINFLDKNVRKLGRYLDFPWNIDEKIIEFKDGKIVEIYQH